MFTGEVRRIQALPFEILREPEIVADQIPPPGHSVIMGHL